jgi:hypothetical protein
VSLREPIDRSKDDELFDVIREWGEARAKKARLREEEDETLATLGALDEIYAPHVEAKHARVGVNVAGKVSEITAQDKEDFAKLLKYSSEWRLSIPDLGWPVAPQIVAAFLASEYGKGADILRSGSDMGGCDGAVFWKAALIPYRGDLVARGLLDRGLYRDSRFRCTDLPNQRRGNRNDIHRRWRWHAYRYHVQRG